MKYLAMIMAALFITGCVSHKMVEEDPRDFPQDMKTIASVKEVPREDRKRWNFKGRQVAGMDYYLTTDPIPGNMRFQYQGVHGAVFHETQPERKKAKVSKRRPVRTVYKTKVDRKDAEILKALQKLNTKLDDDTLRVKVERGPGEVQGRE